MRFVLRSSRGLLFCCSAILSNQGCDDVEAPHHAAQSVGGVGVATKTFTSAFCSLVLRALRGFDVGTSHLFFFVSRAPLPASATGHKKTERAKSTTQAGGQEVILQTKVF